MEKPVPKEIFTMPANRGDKQRVQTDPRSKSKNGRRKSVWAGDEAKRWYILLSLSVVVAVLLFPNILTRPVAYNLGDVATRDIKASQDFLVENRGLTEKDRNEAARGVTAVYDFDPAAGNLMVRVQEAFNLGRRYVTQLQPAVSGEGPGMVEMDQKTAVSSLMAEFFEILDIREHETLFTVLLEGGFPDEAEALIKERLTPILQSGVVGDQDRLGDQTGKGVILHNIRTGEEFTVGETDRFYDLESAREQIRQQGEPRRVMPPALVEASLRLATLLLKPNVTLNKRETEFRKVQARTSVKPVYFKVKKGEMLIREGERVGPESLAKLTEHNKLLRKRDVIGRIPAMALLVAFLISAMYVVGLMTQSSRAKAEVRDLLFSAVTLLVMFLLIAASNFVVEEVARGFTFFKPHALLFAVPVASGAMLIAIFQGLRVSASFSLISAVLAALVVGGRVEFFVYFFISSLVAAHGVRDCRERIVFVKAGLKVSLVSMLMAAAIEALYGSFYSVEMLIAAGSGLASGIFVAIFATGVLPLIEMSFRYTSDIKLLELANLDQPLLRELMVKAPGTHHHSVIVSNMVEACAKSINANPLLAKVSAYYHDIGKMRKPLYFIENQRGENKHEKLAPSMSALILISHVKDGVDLARRHKLGREIIEIIRQHHGSSLITYFYEKAKSRGEKRGRKSRTINQEDFRYPGPKPQTKEAGLVMLADFVEAASRSLVDPNAARIKGMVQKIINKVFSDGQLDECELTLKDLHEIAKSFNQTLSGIFHHRIEYPDPLIKRTPSRVRRGEHGNTDQLPEADAMGQRPADRTEAEESLRRLGTPRQ